MDFWYLIVSRISLVILTLEYSSVIWAWGDSILLTLMLS